MGSDENSQPLDDGFFERDIEYFRDAQYATTTNLNARVALHDKYSTSPQKWFDWLVDQIEWGTSHDVLEVGCGTGLLWAHVPGLATRDLGVTLTDLSQTMVDTAVARAMTNGHVVRGLTADVHTLPFDDASYDLVIANHMLYHSPHPSLAIKEISRVLRPGGKFVASTNGPQHLAELHEIDAAVFETSRARKNNAEIFGPTSGIPMLRECFSDIEWRGHRDAILCTDPDDVVRYLTSMPPGSGASPSQLGLLRSEVVRRMAIANGVLAISKDSGVFLSRKS